VLFHIYLDLEFSSLQMVCHLQSWAKYRAKYRPWNLGENLHNFSFSDGKNARKNAPLYTIQISDLEKRLLNRLLLKNIAKKYRNSLYLAMFFVEIRYFYRVEKHFFIRIWKGNQFISLHNKRSLVLRFWKRKYRRYSAHFRSFVDKMFLIPKYSKTLKYPDILVATGQYKF